MTAFDKAWSLLKEEDDDKPQLGENWANTGYEGVKIPELTDGELLRLEGHPNERIRYKATEELENRAMDRAVTTLATTGATPQEIAEFYEPQFEALKDEYGPMYQYGNFSLEDFKDGVIDDSPESRRAYWESRAGDVEEAMPGQMFIDTPTHEQTYTHARKTAPFENAQRYGKRMKDFVTEVTTPMDLGFLGSDKTLDAPWRKTTDYLYEQASDMRPDRFSNPDYTPSAKEVDRISRMPSEGGLGTRPAVGTATGFQDRWQTKLASEPFDAAWSLLKNENMGLDREEGGPYMRTPSTRSALADIYGRKEGTVGGPENFGVAPPFNPFHPTYRFNPLTRGDAGGLIHPSKIDPRVRGFVEESAKLQNNPHVKPMQPISQADQEEFEELFKEEITDMVEYPPGSGNFVTQEQAQIMQIQERNRQAREALENRNAMRERLVRYD